MQCPNCGREAININGREICLDCGIEIARGVNSVESVETEPVIPTDTDAVTVGAPFSSNNAVQDQPDILSESSIGENIIQDQSDVDTQLLENESVSLPPEMTDDGIGADIQNHQGLAEAVAEQTVDQLVSVTPESDTVTDISPNQMNVLSEDTADHLDFKMEPTIEEIAKNNVENSAPIQESQTDLLDLKADTGTSVTDVTYDAGSDASVEQIVADEEKSPIFTDASGTDISNVPDIPKSDMPIAPEPLNEEIKERESYVNPVLTAEKETAVDSVSYSSGLSNQVDSINIGALGSVPQSSAGMDVLPGNFKGSSNVSEDYGYNADIMPAKGVSRGTYRKIAIMLIIIINIVVLSVIGIVIKNKYFSSTADTTQVEPSVTIE